MPEAVRTQNQAHTQLLSVIDNAKLRNRHKLYWLLASGGTFLDGFSIMLLGISLPLIKKDIPMSPVILGVIASSLVIGAIPGSNIGGPMGDKFGRKIVLLLNTLVILTGAGLCAMADSTWMLITGQLLIGAGIGSDFAAGATFIAEILPVKYRSRLMVGTISLQSVGLISGGLIAFLLIKLFMLKNSWRLFFEVQIIVALVFFVSRLFLVESPRWLMSKGKNLKAGLVLSEFFPDQKKEILQMGRMAGNKTHHVSLLKKHDTRINIRALFSKEYVNRTLLVSIPWFLMDIATYGIGLFTPIILADMHFSETAGNPVSIEIGNITGATLIDTFLLMGFIIALWLVPKIGRIRMQLIGFTGMFIGMLILILNTLVHVSHQQDMMLILSGFVIFNVFMNTGPNATTFTLAPELFPTHLRSSASGFAAGFAKIGAALGIFLVPYIKNNYSLTAVLELMAITIILGFLFTFIFSVKIGENKTLEQRHQHDK